jgi:hypothetical protein
LPALMTSAPPTFVRLVRFTGVLLAKLGVSHAIHGLCGGSRGADARAADAARGCSRAPGRWIPAR